MSTDEKPSDEKPSFDLTFPLIVLYMLIHFFIIIPGVRALNVKQVETKHPQEHPSPTE